MMHNRPICWKHQPARNHSQRCWNVPPMQLILLSLLLLLLLPDGCQSWSSLSAQHRYSPVQPLQAKRTLTIVGDMPHTNHDTGPQNNHDDETNESQLPLSPRMTRKAATRQQKQQQEEASFSLDRRRALWQTATIAVGLLAASSSATAAAIDEDDCGLEEWARAPGPTQTVQTTLATTRCCYPPPILSRT